MINENVKEWLDKKGYEDRLTEHKETIDTVEHAAQQIGCSEAEIAKTLSFIVDEKPVVVVMAGDGRVNSSKFKALFHTKPSMIPRDRVEKLIGFQPGGVWSPLRSGRRMTTVHWTVCAPLECLRISRSGLMYL